MAPAGSGRHTTLPGGISPSPPGTTLRKGKLRHYVDQRTGTLIPVPGLPRLPVAQDTD
jgi:hypothetical protein